MAPKIPKFFKIVLQHNIESSNLKLPTKFTREYSGKLTDVAQLVVFDGRIWKVELRREGNHISLRNGFDEFARHYSLSHGNLLVFKFKGMSCFSVAIYGHSNCKILHNPTTGEEQNDAENQMWRRFVTPQAKKVDCEYMSRCGIPTPTHFRSERPYFEVMLQEYNFTHNYVYMPAKIADSIGKAQLEKRFIWLEVGDERSWEVSIFEKKKGGFFLGRINEFYRDLSLKDNDICIFELVKENLFKVFIFSAF